MKKDIRTINGTDYDLTTIVRNIITNNSYEIDKAVKVETEHFGVEMNEISPYQYVYGVSDYGKFFANLCEWDIEASLHSSDMDEPEISWENVDAIKDYVAQVIEAVFNELNMLANEIDEWFIDSYFDLDKVYEYCKVANVDFLELMKDEDIRERYDEDDINENIEWWCEEHNLPNPDDEHFDMTAEYKEVEFDDPNKDALDIDKINFKAYAEELIHTDSTTFNICGREYEFDTYDGCATREFTIIALDNDYDDVEVSIDNIDEVVDFLRGTYNEIVDDFNSTYNYIADTFYECCDVVEDNKVHHAFDDSINFSFGFNPELVGYYTDQNFFDDGGYIRINDDGTVNTSAWGNFDSVKSMINYRVNKFFKRILCAYDVI